MEMEKQRMEMFLENENEKQDAYFDLTELKKHLKTLPPNERHKVKDFERLRNLKWTRPQRRNEWNWYGHRRTGRGGKGKEKPTRTQKMKETPKTT